MLSLSNSPPSPLLKERGAQHSNYALKADKLF